MKKVFAILLVLSLFFAMNIPVIADSEGIEPYASDLIKSYAISLSCDSDGKLSAIASMSANILVDKVGFPLIRIEKKSGSSWSSVTSTTSKYKTDASKYSYKLTYQGTAGVQYRAYAEFYAQDGSSSDSRNKTSSTVTGK